MITFTFAQPSAGKSVQPMLQPKNWYAVARTDYCDGFKFGFKSVKHSFIQFEYIKGISVKKLFLATTIVLASLSAQATSFTVDAKLNSSSGGIGLDTIALSAGQSFSVIASAADLWSAGDLPRYSNANGLIASTFATGSDESGKTAGTLIGQNYGQYASGGFSAAYGQLVGQIGSQYFALGTNTNGVASSAGTLKLFYWDSNPSDNAGSILVNVTANANVAAVPEPETYAMLLVGLGLVGAVVRRRKQSNS